MKFKIFIVAAILMVPMVGIAGKDKISLEDKTKAAFIYNFTKYIQWTKDTSQVFRIGVVGECGILAPLKEIEKKKRVGKREISVKQYNKTSQIDSCHILFISGSAEQNLPEILDSIRNKNILTIGDTKGFAQKGVAINFVVVNEKMRFQINSSVLDGLDLRVSSQLLKLALFVKGEKKND